MAWETLLLLVIYNLHAGLHNKKLNFCDFITQKLDLRRDSNIKTRPTIGTAVEVIVTASSLMFCHCLFALPFNYLPPVPVLYLSFSPELFL